MLDNKLEDLEVLESLESLEELDEGLLDSETSLKIARISKIAAYITFFTFWSYKGEYLNFIEKKESDAMLAFGEGYVDSFKYFTQQVHFPYFKFSFEFVEYLQIVDGFQEYDYWCEQFINEYYEGEIDDDHKKRFLEKIKILYKNEVSIFDLVDFEDERVAFEAITLFNSIFCLKRKDPIKTKKWIAIKYSVLVVVIICLAIYNFPN